MMRTFGSWGVAGVYSQSACSAGVRREEKARHESVNCSDKANKVCITPTIIGESAGKSVKVIICLYYL